jgi:DNA-binding MarR family transcriptional regulator
MAIGEGNAGDPAFDTEEGRTRFCLVMLTERRIISRYLKKHDWNHASLVMLLELYIADAAEKSLSVSSLGYASCVSLPTATRLAVALETLQLVDRERDPLDGRRINVSLAPRGRAAMRCILDDCAKQRALTPKR